MVANVLQLAPQGKGKKTKKTSSLQDKLLLENSKVKKNINFTTLLNEKLDKKQKTSKESLTSKIQAPIKMQTKEEKSQDTRLAVAQNAPKAKKPKFQEAQATHAELAPVLLSQEHSHKVAQQFDMREKKLKSSKKTASIEIPKTIQKEKPMPSTQEQLVLQTKSSKSKPKVASVLKEALQTPLKSQKSEQKTLGDVAKLAQNLNLTKLELSKSPKQEKPQESKMPDIPSLMSKKPKVISNQLSQIKEKVKTLKTQEAPKLQEHKVANNTLAEALLPPQESPKEPRLKDVGLSELLKMASKDKKEVALEEKAVQEEKKSEKTQDLLMGELKRETSFKIASSKETFTQFSQRIREEILNYKPPFSKLTMELNPVELGKLEITITKKGKELVINVNANNANALHTFMQNQSEFRATLSNVGFSNVELNFSQGEGKGGGNHSQEQGEQKRNKNGLEESITEIPALASMEIKMVQYA